MRPASQSGSARLSRAAPVSAARIVRAHRHRRRGHHRPGVERLGQDHQRHRRFAVAGKDGGRNRGRATVARQRGGVEVQETARWQIQQDPRDQLPVIGEDSQIRP
jgi:hypothetical protein